MSLSDTTDKAIFDLAQTKAAEMLKTAITHGTKEQKQNAIRTLKTMGIFLLANICFNDGNPSGTYDPADTLASIDHVKKCLLTLVKEQEKDFFAGKMDYHSFTKTTKTTKTKKTATKKIAKASRKKVSKKVKPQKKINQYAN